MSKYYLFDFDGVLVDSMDVWAGVHIKALQDAKIHVPENFVGIITPLGNYKASEFTVSLGLNISLEDYLDYVSKSLYKEYTTNIKLKSNVKEALTKLKNDGICLNVLTASPHLYVDECLKRLGVLEFFDNIWTVDDFGCTKQETKIFKLAAKRLNTAIENCTMLDDNLTAIKTAKSAGMNTIAVFDKSSYFVQKELEENSDKYIKDFSEIM